VVLPPGGRTAGMRVDVCLLTTPARGREAAYEGGHRAGDEQPL